MSSLQPIRFESVGAKLLAGLRQPHRFESSVRGIADQWRDFRALGNLPEQLSPIEYGVMCGATASGLEYMCATEVGSFTSLSPHLGRIRFQPQQYAVFRHAGHVSTLPQTWQELIEQWLPQSSYQSAHRPDFELYSANFNHDTGVGDIEVWIAVVPRS